MPSARGAALPEVQAAGDITGRTATNNSLGHERMSGYSDVRTVPKPWGHETIWAQTDRYVGKILHIRGGHELSLQYHNRKDETVYLLAGKLIYRVKQGERLEDVPLEIGQAFRLTPGTVHQMVAVTDCQVLEVSTPELDDVVRITDKYGREGTSAP
jgi:mannose-6-phosphate isomerase